MGLYAMQTGQVNKKTGKTYAEYTETHSQTVSLKTDTTSSFKCNYSSTIQTDAKTNS